jgi:hypothetical protein
MPYNYNPYMPYPNTPIPPRPYNIRELEMRVNHLEKEMKLLERRVSKLENNKETSFDTDMYMI